MNKDFMSSVVSDYLKSLGLPSGAALSYGLKAADYFEEQACNSRDPFKDCCDYVGKMAQIEVKGFKYKSPKAKSARRSKRPQEAFDFKD